MYIYIFISCLVLFFKSNKKSNYSGSVYQDHLQNYDQALHSYNMAFELLTVGDTTNITDPPPDPNPILSQLQYRIGTYSSTVTVSRTLIWKKNSVVSCFIFFDPIIDSLMIHIKYI